ncbi:MULTISPECIES: antiviral RADAR system accessory protein RdrD [unclassified Shewanella]|uniref:antiviral RADAR system accessory protein RdrD n=1 Tax=Shewanella TaxID=22 RepID=UPI0021D8981D|nr:MULTISPECIES: antiviral RADAR system accessory protein RdrD [unclassified Shewanella]MCU7964523.1 hypothetical protein [Shewanella sp. SW32]MCU7972492.1 hypothetical protein [Shewanella sp. SW29]MCU8020934.1 hypothetical protein [Shewanella sp. SM78]MCU8043741.1 hypothetical protein [Shewanella sp. SM68]MCU8047824.1 hypothetical protein [Shewanella sp. SM65]
MSQNNIKPITNYTELLAVLNATKVELKDKVKETNWLRYTFRRIPLYSATGLIFFAVCLAMAMVDQIGFKVIDQFLKQPISLDFNWPEWILGISFLLLLIFLFVSSTKQSDVEALSLLSKFATNSLLLDMLLVGGLVVITSPYPLQLGLALFSVVTLSAMLIERSLGFTRRNERYQLFASRAEGLCILFASREKLGVPFVESHLLELGQFYEALRLNKHNDTISDSHYLLAQVERLKDASK